MHDLRIGLRMLRKTPGSTLAIAGLLALGIGASTAIFSLFDTLLLRPLPARHAERLVRIAQHLPRVGALSSFDYAYYEALRDHATTLESVFGQFGESAHFAMSEPLPAEQVTATLVTPEFFDALGIQALYGRALTAADGRDTDTLPAVLSYGFWQRRFHGDPQALGRTLAIQGHAFVVVGVMPRGVNGLTVDTAADVSVPARALPLLTTLTLERAGGLEIAGRLKPGVTCAQAHAECLSLWQSVIRSSHKGSPSLVLELSRGITLDPPERGTSILRERFGGSLELLMASVGLLLLLVCINIAGLLLARMTGRQQEIAVRLAVGATRARLMRQMLAESLPLAVAGAAGGLLLAYTGIPLAMRALPPIRDRAASLRALSLDAAIDWRVLAFSLAASLFALAIFGLAPALAASRTSLDSVLRGARLTGGGRGRQILVAVQIALCTFLLAGAGLFVRTFKDLRNTNPGFDSEHIATFTLDLSGHGYTPQTEPALLRSLIARAGEIPGVVSASVAARGVMRDRGVSTTVAPEGQRITPADFLNANLNAVSTGYFDTMGMHLIAGRVLTEADAPPTGALPAGPMNVVVSQAFAERFFPGEDPLGKRFGIGIAGSLAKADDAIVGVVSDAKYRSLREPFSPILYQAMGASDSVVLNVRTRVRPEAIFEPVRKVLASMDPMLALLEVHRMDEEVDASASSERLLAALASIFAGLAALIAVVGLYALLTYAVAQRQREIGIRIALGADAMDIAALTFRQTLGIAFSGIAAGLGGALAAGPLIRSLLYGVSPQDPASLAMAAVFAILVAAAATAIPTAGAMHIAPADALRKEG
jgi:putative ABC transport system permease protein